MSHANTLIGSTVLASVAGISGGYFGARLRESESTRSGVFDELSAHRLRIVNESGIECGRFEGGGHSTPRTAYLNLGGGSPDDPFLHLSVDDLEGTPTAMVYMRSPGVDPGKLGIVILNSRQGRPDLALSEADPKAPGQLVQLGTWETGNPSVLHLERPGQISDWPK